MDRRRRQMSTFDARTQRVQSPDGAFEVRRLAAGTHELQVSGATGETGTQVVTVQAGRTQGRPAHPAAAPALRVTGRVLEHGSGKPIAGLTVAGLGPGQRPGRGGDRPRRQLRDRGRADRRDASAVGVQADFNRYVGESKELEVKPGQTPSTPAPSSCCPATCATAWAWTPAERGRLWAPASPSRTARPRSGPCAPTAPPAGPGSRRATWSPPSTAINTSDLGNGALSYLTAGKAGATITLMVESPGSAPRRVDIVLEAWKPPAPPVR